MILGQPEQDAEAMPARQLRRRRTLVRCKYL